MTSRFLVGAPDCLLQWKGCGKRRFGSGILRKKEPMSPFEGTKPAQNMAVCWLSELHTVTGCKREGAQFSRAGALWGEMTLPPQVIGCSPSSAGQQEGTSEGIRQEPKNRIGFENPVFLRGSYVVTWRPLAASLAFHSPLLSPQSIQYTVKARLPSYASSLPRRQRLLEFVSLQTLSMHPFN